MKKGFTLVELLAVIVILAVILVIAVPQINNVIKQTKINSLGGTAKLIAAKVEEASVENEILENNESITCANLVKLDDNYGSCTVSMVNGKGTVTLVGANKFAGITCTGTKDNMTCTEGSAPEYVYTWGAMHYDYTVTNEETCKSVIKQLLLDDGSDEEYATSQSNSVCTNTDAITNEYFQMEYEKGITYTVTNSNACEAYFKNNWKDEPNLDYTYVEEEFEAICNNLDGVENTSEWFADAIAYGSLTYSDISSFVRSTNIYDEFVERSDMLGVTTDYTTLRYATSGYYADKVAKVFKRVDKSGIMRDAICVLYPNASEETLECFELTDYTSGSARLEAVFGNENCENTNLYGNEAFVCENEGFMCAITPSGLYAECRENHYPMIPMCIKRFSNISCDIMD